ncbi:putative glycine cleavage system H protein, mitochondrial precursor [Atractiella rhizophila]|nr:putative glycine cleavage system H protein, mitochondrial precursor [Atractiella rhizophila]
MSTRVLFRPLSSARRICPSTRVSSPYFPAAGRGIRAFRTTPHQFEIVKKFSKEHEWISFDTESKIGTVGITTYAQNSLGDVVYIELPEKGTEVKQGDFIGTVESVKAASDVYVPVSGTIEEVNSVLSEKTSVLNKSPEADGWLIKVKLSEVGETDELMDEKAYSEFCAGQEH